MERNNKIQSELNEYSKIVADIPFTNVYQTPFNYFEDLPDTINQSILQDSDEIAIIPKTNQSIIYQLPPNYFEELSDKIITAIHLEKDNVRKLSFSFRNIALAACIIGVLGFFIFNLLISDPKPQLDKNTAELISQANQILKNNKLESEIDKLNEADLVSFVEDNGHDVEAALVASLSDEIEHSDNDFYFYDDESLRHYLTEKNIYKKNTFSN